MIPSPSINILCYITPDCPPRLQDNASCLQQTTHSRRDMTYKQMLIPDSSLIMMRRQAQLNPKAGTSLSKLHDRKQDDREQLVSAGCHASSFAHDTMSIAFPCRACLALAVAAIVAGSMAAAAREQHQIVAAEAGQAGEQHCATGSGWSQSQAGRRDRCCPPAAVPGTPPDFTLTVHQRLPALHLDCLYTAQFHACSGCGLCTKC